MSLCIILCYFVEARLEIIAGYLLSPLEQIPTYWQWSIGNYKLKFALGSLAQCPVQQKLMSMWVMILSKHIDLQKTSSWLIVKTLDLSLYWLSTNRRNVYTNYKFTHQQTDKLTKLNVRLSQCNLNVSVQGNICVVIRRIAAKLATFLSFVGRYVLSSKPLVQDVQHFSAEVDE